MTLRPGLRFRLMAVNAAGMAVVLVSAYFSQTLGAQAEAAAEALSSRSVQAIELAAQLETLMHEKSYVSNYLLSSDARYLRDTQQHYEDVGRWVDSMRAFAATPEEHVIVDALRADYMRYVQEGDKVIAQDRAGARQAALSTFFAMKRDVEGLLYNGQKLFALEGAAMQSSRQDTARSMAQQRRIVLVLTGLGALLSGVMSALLTTLAVRPIYRLVLRLGAASGHAGDVTLESHNESHDELGALEAHVGGLLTRMRAQERKLARSARLSQLGELAAELAHEILNPIAGVKAMLQALQRTPHADTDGLAFELAAMERDLGRVEHTIKRLMRYARPFEPNLAVTPLGELVQRALEAVHKLPAHAGRRIEVAPYNAGMAWLLDKELLVQVLVNLLVNACEAAPPDSVVHLALRVEGARGADSVDNQVLCMQVRDHGPGLTSEVQSRLFHPFFTTKASGNGLGLAVSRNIVQEHGGAIAGRTAAEGGALFTVTLPRGGV